MSLFDLILLGVLIAIVIALFRANNVLGNNPHQQVKALEDLLGPLPVKMSLLEKLRLNDFYGISPTNSRRAGWLAVLVVLIFVAMLWLRR